jgi:hypothetical protein
VTCDYGCPTAPVFREGAQVATPARLREVPDAKRFWSKVDKSGGPDACWPWTTGHSSKGYGHAQFDRRTQRAHRVALELSGVSIPSGRMVLHRCDNPPCCNPAHLFLGTAADNAHDNRIKGRRNSQQILTPTQVLEIRSKYVPFKYSQRRLAKEYGVSDGAIYAIVSGRFWRHLLPPVSREGSELTTAPGLLEEPARDGAARSSLPAAHVRPESDPPLSASVHAGTASDRDLPPGRRHSKPYRRGLALTRSGRGV